jgi:hypothetical protein
MENSSWLKITSNSLNGEYREPVFDPTVYYTTLVTGSSQKNSNILSLSSTKNICVGHEVYCSPVDGYFAVVDVDHKSSKVLLNAPVPQSFSNFTVVFREPYIEEEDEEDEEEEIDADFDNNE